MRYLVYFLFLSVFLSCDNPEPNDLLPHTQVDIIINLNNPEFNGLQIPGGWAYASGGIKGLLLYNRNGAYIAYERACPHLSLESCTPMTFDGFLLKCTCDGSLFNIFNGGVSETAGINYYAREYHVQIVGAGSLRITNY